MRSVKLAIFSSAALSAIVVAGLAWYVSTKVIDGTFLPDTRPSEERAPTVDTSRMMAPEDPGISLYLDSENDLVLRYPSGIFPITDREKMTGNGYSPLCDPLHALVCFPYDPPEYIGTNLEGAAFSIHLRDDIETEAECMAVQPAEIAEGAVMLGETVFSAFSFSEATLSRRLDGRNYRAYRKGGCYELATRVMMSAQEVSESGTIREFKPADQANLRAELDKMLKSFRFQDDLELI